MRERQRRGAGLPAVRPALRGSARGPTAGGASRRVRRSRGTAAAGSRTPGSDSVQKIDPGKNRVSRSIKLAPGTRPCGIAVGAGAIWVDGYGSNTIEKIDRRRMKRVRSIRVGRAPFDVRFAFGSVWSSDNQSAHGSRIDRGRTGSSSESGSPVDRRGSASQTAPSGSARPPAPPSTVSIRRRTPRRESRSAVPNVSRLRPELRRPRRLRRRPRRGTPSSGARGASSRPTPRRTRSSVPAALPGVSIQADRHGHASRSPSTDRR